MARSCHKQGLVIGMVMFVLIFGASAIYILTPGDEPLKNSLPEPPLATRPISEVCRMDIETGLSEDDYNILASAGLVAFADSPL